MADRRPAPRTRSQPRNTTPLRPPSSLDRLFAWIEALPGPAWIFYGGDHPCFRYPWAWAAMAGRITCGGAPSIGPDWPLTFSQSMPWPSCIT